MKSSARRPKTPTSTAALEAQADRVADRAGQTTPSARRTRDKQRPSEALRRPVEQQMGVDLSDVRFHTSSSAESRVASLGADAYASGSDVYFGPSRYQPALPDGQRLIQHELAHVAQMRAAEDAATEDQDRANRGALDAPLPATGNGLKLFGCGGGDREKVMAKLRGGQQLTRDEATSAMDEYEDMNSSEREKTINDIYKYGAAKNPIENLLAALSEDQRINDYRDEIRDMLQRVQRRGTEGASGKTVDQLAKTQGQHLESKYQAKALKDAQAEAKKKGLPPPKKPTKEQVKKSFEKDIKKEAGMRKQKDEWKALTQKERDEWMPMAEKVRKDIIDLAKKEVPNMALKESDIALRPKYIAKEGVRRQMSLFALSGRPMTVGIKFIKTAKADPRYVLGPVLHEIHGHPMHGGEPASLAMQIFEKSKAHYPSYSKPAKTEGEKQLYGYPETEIYAEMIEHRHSQAVTKKHWDEGVRGSDTPARDILTQVRKLARNLEPTVARAVFLGMWERFRLDPRLTDDARDLFKNAVNGLKDFKDLIK